MLCSVRKSLIVVVVVVSYRCRFLLLLLFVLEFFPILRCPRCCFLFSPVFFQDLALCANKIVGLAFETAKESLTGKKVSKFLLFLFGQRKDRAEVTFSSGLRKFRVDEKG